MIKIVLVSLFMSTINICNPPVTLIECEYLVNEIQNGYLEQSTQQYEDFITVLYGYGFIWNDMDVVSLLALALTENPTFSPTATCHNKNSTNDLGLYQHNSRYWNERMIAAIHDFRETPFSDVLDRIELDRTDLVLSLMVTIYNLDNIRTHYKTYGEWVYIAHHGAGWATNRRYSAHTASYLSRFRHYKTMLNDMLLFYRGMNEK